MRKDQDKRVNVGDRAADPSPPARRAFPPELGLVIGVTAASTASTFIRIAQTQMSPAAVAAWRLSVASAILAPFALTTRRAEWRALSRREWGWMLASGVALAIHFYTWITSLALTSVAASVVLVATNPFFVAMISYFFFKARVSRAMLVGMAVAFVGTMIIAMSDLGQGSHQLAGDLLALVGAVAVAAYMLIGQRLRARLSLLGYVFPVYATAAVVLMLTAILSGVRLWGFAPYIWLNIALVALIPQIVGHSSLNWALGHLPTTYVALSVLAEPIGSVFLAWLILHEPPTWQTILGGALILGGIVIARGRKRTIADHAGLTD